MLKIGVLNSFLRGYRVLKGYKDYYTLVYKLKKIKKGGIKKNGISC